MNILQTEDTICAIATAQGGAIGTIRVSGPEAITLTDRIFKPVSGKPLAERAPYTLTFGHILTPEGEIIDEVLVSLFRAPPLLHWPGFHGNLLPRIELHPSASDAAPHPPRMPCSRTG